MMHVSTSLRWTAGLTHKYFTSLERLAKSKRSSLLEIFENYCHKKFQTLVPVGTTTFSIFDTQSLLSVARWLSAI